MLRTARCIHYLASVSPVDAFDRGPEWNLEMQQISHSTTPQPAACEFAEDVYSNISRVLVKQILDLQETLEFYDLYLRHAAPADEPVYSLSCGVQPDCSGAMEPELAEEFPNRGLP